MGTDPVGSLPTPTWAYSAVRLPAGAREGDNPARTARLCWKRERAFKRSALLHEMIWMDILEDFAKASGL